MLGGKILKVGRKVRGFTQDEVAAVYGVNPRTYRRWEAGVNAVPFDDVAMICEHIFKISIADIQGLTVNV